MDLLAICKGILPPVLVALALISVGGNRLLPLAIGLGLAMVFVLLEDWPTWPHHLWSHPNGTHWLFWCLVAAMLVASLELWRCLPDKVGLAFGLVLAAVSVWFVLQNLVARQTTGWGVMQVGGGGLAVAAIVLSQRRLIARSESSPFFPAFVLSILIVDAVVLTLGRGALLGQMCGACAAALGAAISTSFWRKPFTMSIADGTWFGIVHGLVLFAGVHFSYLTWPAALLAAAAPVLPLALPSSFAKERPKRWMLVALMLAGLPAMGAIALLS